MKTFICEFEDGLKCKVTVSDRAPVEAGFNHILGFEWSGHTLPRHTRPFIAWMNSVNQSLSDEWGQGIMQYYGSINKPEIWVFNPGKSPQKISSKP